jgi:hypothetical protein
MISKKLRIYWITIAILLAFVFLYWLDNAATSQISNREFFKYFVLALFVLSGVGLFIGAISRLMVSENKQQKSKDFSDSVRMQGGKKL